MSAYEGIVVLNYKLARKLGEGGFGAVYLAEHESLGRKAAVKILHPEFARNKGLVDRFFNEAKAVCAIGHRAIIDIQNFGYLDTGEPYYLMEYFPGQDLGDRIEKGGPLNVAELVTVFTPVVSALTAAHAKKIIHRDLKPENIMLIEEGGAIVDVKLLDFGIAKLVDDRVGHESKTGVAMGTPQYMAPEQARDSKNVDERADVYALGATIFNALCGRPPFVASNITDLILQIHTQEPPRLRGFAAGIPMELDDAVDRCLAKEPDARPASVAEAWSSIAAACEAPALTPVPGTRVSASSAPVLQPASSPDIDSSPDAMARGNAAPDSGLSEPAKGRKGWVYAALGLLLLGGLGTVLATQLGGGESVASEASMDATITASASEEVPPPVVPSLTRDAGAVIFVRTADAAPEDPLCSIYDYLTLQNGIDTVAKAEAKLADFEKCRDEGKIRPDQFVGLEDSLIKDMNRLRKTEKASRAPIRFNVSVRGPLKERFTGHIDFSPARGRITGSKLVFTKLRKLHGSFPSSRFIFTVHTDSGGSERESKQRTAKVAAAVTKNLIGAGIPAHAFDGRGAGEQQPISSNSTAKGRAQNRRVEVFFRPPAKGQGSGIIP